MLNRGKYYSNRESKLGNLTVNMRYAEYRDIHKDQDCSETSGALEKIFALKNTFFVFHIILCHEVFRLVPAARCIQWGLRAKFPWLKSLHGICERKEFKFYSKLWICTMRKNLTMNNFQNHWTYFDTFRHWKL